MTDELPPNDTPEGESHDTDPRARGRRPAAKKTVKRPARTRSDRPASGSKRKKEPATGLFVSKLTGELTEKIAANIEAGVLPDTAANAAGVHVRTYRRWLMEGRAWIEEHDDDELPSPEAAFSARIDLALSRFRVMLETRLANADDWRAAIEVLQRRFPTEWGKRDRLDIGNPEGEAFSIAGMDLTRFNLEELRTLRALVAKGAALDPPDPDGGGKVIDMPSRRRELEAGS